MTIAGLSDYLPLSDLAKIVAVALIVAVVAPAGVSIAVLGLDRRDREAGTGTSGASSSLLIGAGVIILAGLIAAGLYALFTD